MVRSIELDEYNYIRQTLTGVNNNKYEADFIDESALYEICFSCLLKSGTDMYNVILDMLSYNINYIDMCDSGDDFINNVLEYAIQVKDLDFLNNECFKFIIDVLFPNKIYDRIRATLMCMGKDINEVDEWYNCIKKVGD